MAVWHLCQPYACQKFEALARERIIQFATPPPFPELVRSKDEWTLTSHSPHNRIASPPRCQFPQTASLPMRSRLMSTKHRSPCQASSESLFGCGFSNAHEISTVLRGLIHDWAPHDILRFQFKYPENLYRDIEQ